jgi:hypothetical protein
MAAGHGLRRRALERLVVEGEVRRLLHEVYAPAALKDSTELRCWATALVLPQHAVVVDRTAAWLWGIDAYSLDDLTSVPPLDVFVLRGHKRINRPQVRGGERDLLPEDATLLHGVRITTPVRTGLDLACRLPAYEAMAALDAFARRQGVTTEQLYPLLRRFRGRRGVVQARRLVPLVDGRIESSGESFTKLAIVDAGLPLPEPQFWIEHRGRPLFRLDLAYPRLKICVEYDGAAFHTSDEQREHDRRRRRWLRDNGWIVIVVTRESFAGDALFVWLRELRAAIEARSQSR